MRDLNQHKDPKCVYDFWLAKEAANDLQSKEIFSTKARGLWILESNNSVFLVVLSMNSITIQGQA